MISWENGLSCTPEATRRFSAGGFRSSYFACMSAAAAIAAVLTTFCQRSGRPRHLSRLTKKLSADGICALSGPVGTPTSAAAKPIAEGAGVPFIGPFTGAELLRTPFQRNVVNVRGSYFQETELMVERLTADLGLTRIAILFQDDAFGRAGYEGTVRALAKRGMQLAAEATFERNTTAVRAGLLALRRADPQAVITIGPYQPIAEFVRLARRVKLEAVLLTVSFVGADALASDLGADGEGVVITQVVPFPRDESVPVVRRYAAALSRAAPGAKPGFVSLEGYIAGRLAVEALRRAGAAPPRAAFLDAIYAAPFDIDGLPLAFGPGDNQGSESIFLTAIRGAGEIRPVGNLRELAR